MNRIIMYFIGEFAFYFAIQAIELIGKLPALLTNFFVRKHKQQDAPNPDPAVGAVLQVVSDETTLLSSEPFDSCCSAGCCEITEEFQHSLDAEERHRSDAGSNNE